jgi:uncharacterized membrane protein (DUF441 family)
MIPLIVGLILIAVTVFAALPNGLAWGPQIIETLKGGLPIATAFFGILVVFLGIADITDMVEANKEEKAGVPVDESK